MTAAGRRGGSGTYEGIKAAAETVGTKERTHRSTKSTTWRGSIKRKARTRSTHLSMCKITVCSLPKLIRCNKRKSGHPKIRPKASSPPPLPRSPPPLPKYYNRTRRGTTPPGAAGVSLTPEAYFPHARLRTGGLRLASHAPSRLCYYSFVG